MRCPRFFSFFFTLPNTWKPVAYGKRPGLPLQRHFLILRPFHPLFRAFLILLMRLSFLCVVSFQAAIFRNPFKSLHTKIHFHTIASYKPCLPVAQALTAFSFFFHFFGINNVWRNLAVAENLC
jgi:hypothetical protein